MFSRLTINTFDLECSCFTRFELKLTKNVRFCRESEVQRDWDLALAGHERETRVNNMSCPGDSRWR